MTDNQIPKTRQLKIDNQMVTIRPICPEDAELETSFIEHLSPESRHYRFLGAVNQLPAKLMAQLCNVDFDHTAAFIATVGSDENGGEREKEIGVVRYAPDSYEDVREMAITIADEWQNKGLGTILAQELIDFARKQGIRELYSVDLADNFHMHNLAKVLGMAVKPDPNDARQVIYSLTL